MRAANGHPEPYNVKYWEVGNEIWGSWVRGHSDAETYGRNYNRYHRAMRAVDPTIKFIAVGDNDMSWNRTVLKLAGERIDYLAIHHYYTSREMKGDPLNLMARPLFYERFYKQVEQLLREVRETGQRVSVVAARLGVTTSSAYLWLKEASESTSTSTPVFARVVRESEASRGLVIEVGGATIRVEAGFDVELLRRVVAVLSAPA